MTILKQSCDGKTSGFLSSLKFLRLSMKTETRRLESSSLRYPPLTHRLSMVFISSSSFAFICPLNSLSSATDLACCTKASENELQKRMFSTAQNTMAVSGLGMHLTTLEFFCRSWGNLYSMLAKSSSFLLLKNS